MGQRLTRIYTRTGDDGSTGLADGSRVRKDDLRIEALGAVDELNSAVGVLLADVPDGDLRNILADVQHDLFDLGGELSIPGHTLMTEGHSARLEAALDTLNATLPTLKEFVLPGGTRGAAAAHLARAICRRAERRVIALSARESQPPTLVQYLNRLSDLLFVIARICNHRHGGGDVLWQQGKNR